MPAGLVHLNSPVEELVEYAGGGTAMEAVGQASHRVPEHTSDALHSVGKVILEGMIAL